MTLPNGVVVDAVTVTHVTETRTYDPETGESTNTKTTTSATFSAQPGHEGDFMHGTTQTITGTGNAKSQTGTVVDTGIQQLTSYGQAVRLLGPSVTSQAQDQALSLVDHLGDALAHDHHGVVQGGAAVIGLACMIAEPCGAGLTIGSAIVGGVDFAAEKLKWF